jgi:hypothetical protein
VFFTAQVAIAFLLVARERWRDKAQPYVAPDGLGVGRFQECLDGCRVP